MEIDKEIILEKLKRSIWIAMKKGHIRPASDIIDRKIKITIRGNGKMDKNNVIMEDYLKVNTLHKLGKLAAEKKSVIVPGTTFDKPKPASFIMNLQGNLILKYLNSGMYEYRKRTYKKS